MNLDRYRHLVAFVLWALVAAVVVLLPPSLVLGVDLIGVKAGLFVLGLLSTGVGLLLLKPSRHDGEADDPVQDLTRVESLVSRLPPARSVEVPPEEQVALGVKIVVAGGAMLLTSYVMEAWFGVHV